MKLEDVNAVVRPRRSWEAVDLGFALVRHFSEKVFGAWLATVAPLFALIIVLLWNSPSWALMLIVFIKPLAGRVPLYVISRGLFGEVPRVREVVKAFPRMLYSKLFPLMLTYRLSLNRSFVMPVIELEGTADRKERKVRVDGLSRFADNAGAVTLLCSLLEFAMFLTVMFFGFLMIPEAILEKAFWGVEDFFTNFDLLSVELFRSEFLVPIMRIVVVVYTVAILLVEPFYVGAGFGMYLNVRSILEGWDVELSFRRLAKRLDTVVAEETETKASTPLPTARSVVKVLIIGLALCLTAAPSASYADEVPEEDSTTEAVSDVRAAALEIQKREEFKVVEREVWVPDPKPTDGNSFNFWNLFALSGLLHVLFWVLVIAAVGVLIYFIVTHLSGARISLPKLSVPRAKPKIETFMGMELSPKSLPGDLVGEARRLWSSGAFSEALGLLYRGSIAWLVYEASLPIEESDTEGDCLRRVNLALAGAPEAGYFDRLTGHWMMTVYAQLPPSSAEFDQLCATWPFEIGAAAPAAKGGRS